MIKIAKRIFPLNLIPFRYIFDKCLIKMLGRQGIKKETHLYKER